MKNDKVFNHKNQRPPDYSAVLANDVEPDDFLSLHRFNAHQRNGACRAVAVSDEAGN